MYRARFSDGGSTVVYHALVLLERLTCLVADHVIATNESYKAVEIERDYVPVDRITIVRNGVEIPTRFTRIPFFERKRIQLSLSLASWDFRMASITCYALSTIAQ